MTSAPTMTIIKMLETLPEQLQGRVVEHACEYIEDLKDEFRWKGQGKSPGCRGAI
jgi:hypothetical protein